MSGLADFRTALQQQLADDLGMQFLPGRFEGPNQSERNLGSVYVQRVQEIAGRILEQQMYAIVRIYLRYEQPQDGEDVWDPSPLEDLAEQLQTSISAHQTGMGSAWFQRVISIELDPATQGIEAVIVATAANTAVV